MLNLMLRGFPSLSFFEEMRRTKVRQRCLRGLERIPVMLQHILHV
jgi:hypothetical protein